MKSRLIIAVMYSDKDIYGECKKDLIELFGEVSKESDEYDFDKFTSYYEKEMGKRLVKRFIVFRKDVEKKELSDVKLKTTDIEKKYAKDEKRTINLDPGYLNESELVLASFKRGTNYKEQISDKVWLHKVLEFKGKEAITFWHTFPDYREKKEFFLNYC